MNWPGVDTETKQRKIQSMIKILNNDAENQARLEKIKMRVQEQATEFEFRPEFEDESAYRWRAQARVAAWAEQRRPRCRKAIRCTRTACCMVTRGGA
jgi:hypothetical protein